MWIQAVWYDLFSSAVFLPYFSMLILSLPLLGLGFESTCLSPGFYVRRPKQYDMICWELNLISGFFAFFWLIVWGDAMNKCGWCLAGSRWCWLMGLHQITDPKCELNISSFVTLPHLLDCLICTRNSVSIVLLSWMMGRWHRLVGGGGRLIHIRGWVLSHSLLFFTCAFAFCSLLSCLIF